MPRTPSPPSATEAEPRGKRERRKEARPGELLDAALELFVEKGFAATRVEEVAARAGVSKGTLFLYFPSKEDLFKAVVRESITGRFTEWTDMLQHYEGSTEELVRECLRQWWERIGNTRASGITKLVMSEAGMFPEIADFYQREVIEPGNQLIGRILTRGVARGEFRPMDIDHAILGLVAPLIFMVMWKHSLAPCSAGLPHIDPETFLNQQADLLLHGLLVRPGETR
jgi:AcrR family transcriptional regulator